MKIMLKVVSGTLLACLLLAAVPARAAIDLTGHDTDLFTTNPNIPAQVPNVLIMLDNTSNWSRQSQQWPATVDAACTAAGITGNQQGDAEVCAIYKTVSTLNESVNVGMMMMNDQNKGAFVYFPMKSMTSANRTALQTRLTAINTNSPNFKTSATANYENPMNDVFRYFNNLAVYSSGGASSTVADAGGYTSSAMTNFQFAAGQNGDTCGYDYIIFMGNGYPNAGTISEITAAAALLNDSNVIVNTAAIQNTGTNADVWARFMFQYGVKVGTGAYRHITTYTVDVCNAQCDANQATLLTSMATVSHGKYFKATSLSGITAALDTIFSEVQSVNSVFAATTLPVSINVRGTNLNQVYIGVFRPDAQSSPKWLGNLKLYQLGVANASTSELQLVDASAAAALNLNTGFVSNTAKSFWTSASTFWGFRSPFATTDVGGSSDSPDGDLVEKGGAAQQIRTVYATPDLNAAQTRNIYTCTGTCAAGSALSAYAFNDANTNITSNALGTLATISVTSLTAGTISGTAPNQTTSVTAVTATPHGFANGQAVVIAGAVPNLYNSASGGSVTLTSVPSTTSFTYTVTGTAPDLTDAFVTLPGYTLRTTGSLLDRVLVKNVSNATAYNTAGITATPPGAAISAVVGNANQFSYALGSAQSVAAIGYSVTAVKRATSASWSSADSMVTVTIPTHGYSNGDTVNMSGVVADSAFFGTGGSITNANFVVSQITANTFKYSNGATPAGGSITSALATTSAAHGFSSGATIKVSGVTNNTSFNNTSTITTSGANAFTYSTTATVPGGSSGTGTTLIAQNVVTGDIDNWPITAASMNSAGSTITATLGAGTALVSGQVLHTLAAADPIAVQGLVCTKPVAASNIVASGNKSVCPASATYPKVSGLTTYGACSCTGSGNGTVCTEYGITTTTMACTTASATAYTFSAASATGNSANSGAQVLFTFGTTGPTVGPSAATGNLTGSPTVTLGTTPKIFWTGQSLGPSVAITTIAAGSATVNATGAVYAAKDGDITSVVTSITSQAKATGTITAADANSSDPNERTHLINWVRGKDNVTGADENGNGTAGDACDLANTCDIRASVHGDVLHARPAVINYNRNSTSSVTDDNDVYVFYGANDGMLHAMKGGTDSTGGKEQWAFVAPEFFGKFRRLRNQTPIISSSNPREYFFDGPMGVYTLDADKNGKLGSAGCGVGSGMTACDNAGDKVKLFVGMRRGGRMLYAMEVTDPKNPKLLWKKGCPNMGNNTGCDTGYSELGQTWSEPKLGYLRKWPDKLVLIFAAGYDPDVEDFQPCVITAWNTTSVTGIKNVLFPSPMNAANCPPSGTGTQVNRSMGRGIFIVDAADGTVLWRAGPDASADKQVTAMTYAMPGDLAVLRNRSNTTNRVNAVTGNENVPTGFLDRIYGSDTGGNLWRIDVANASTANWVVTKVASIASTTGTPAATNMRKFMFAPDVVYTNDGIGDFDAVLLGTGDREHPFDQVVQNRFYMFKDRFTATITPAMLLVTATTPVTISDSSTDLYDVTNNCLQSTTVCTSSQQTAAQASLLAASGWKLVLSTSGEKTIAPGTTAAGTVIFNTNEPKQDTVTGVSANVGSNSGNFCTSDLGTARQYGVSFKDGTATFIFNSLASQYVPSAGGGRYATFAGGGFLPTPVPVVVQIGGKYYQSVISGVTTTNPGGLKLQTRVRTYWYKKVD